MPRPAQITVTALAPQIAIGDGFRPGYAIVGIVPGQAIILEMIYGFRYV
jgi:hypothetical protein